MEKREEKGRKKEGNEGKKGKGGNGVKWDNGGRRNMKGEEKGK